MMRFFTPLWLLASASLGTACTTGEPASGPGGKTDDLVESCTAAEEDPLCLLSDHFYKIPFAPQLRTVEIARLRSPDEADELTTAQILAGFSAVSDGEFPTIEDCFAYMDRNEVRIHEVEYLPTGEVFTQFEMTGGDNGFGFFFRKGTMEKVAHVGDDNIFDCTVHLPALFDPRCGPSVERCQQVNAAVVHCIEEWGHGVSCPSFYDENEVAACCQDYGEYEFCGETPENLCLFGEVFPQSIEFRPLFSVGDKGTLTADSALSAEQSQHLVLGFQALGFDEVTSPATAFELLDGGAIKLEMVWSLGDYHPPFWLYSFEVNDTSAGFFFKLDTLDLAAVTIHGTYEQCTVFREPIDE